MNNQNDVDQDDDLIYFYKNFETILSSQTTTIDSVSAGVDFKVFGEYFIKDLHDIEQRMINADDDCLLYVCEHLFNLIEWLRLILENRNPMFGDALERLFDREFGDGHIWQTMYDTCLDRWMAGKNGQHRLGINTYSVVDGALYYRDYLKHWSKVDRETAFDVKPVAEPLNDEAKVALLNDTYRDTSYDQIIKQWQEAGYANTLPHNFSEYSRETTTPEDYLDFTVGNIKYLLANPVSVGELQRWSGDNSIDFEETVKLCATALDLVEERRKDDSQTIYLLRDCMIFQEINKTLDILNAKELPSDQLLIGRKLLSNNPEQWGYYIALLEALYQAHSRYPDDFSKFYNEFSRLLDLFIEVNPNFRALINTLASYIKLHVTTDKKRIVIYDVGFQGTINLLIKYVIDTHIYSPASGSDIETDIEVAIGAEWSRELFENRAKGYYFPFLNRFQRLARSDRLYSYQFGSLNDGKVKVEMGSDEWQRKAATELVVLVTIAQLRHSS